MKRVFYIFLGLLILLISFLLLGTRPVEEKEIYLPDMTLINLQQEEIKIHSFLGEQDLLLLFMHPQIESSLLQLEYLEAVKPPLKMIFIVLGHFPKEELMDELKEKEHVLMDRDTTFGKNLEVYSIPSILLFDRTGKLKKRYGSLLTKEDLVREFPP